ncbi:MAG: hypothetical protein D6689_20035 [Deltaproteobacteria bacterium]|nr:MAG: hypothetical protein D6689_20035 [Deltaproteobacteria bacterium]
MLTLYHRPACPYCMRVRLLLARKGVAFDTVSVPPGAKPEALLARNPAGTVPVLDIGSDAFAESLVIAEYIEDRFPEPALLPGDPAARARARLHALHCDRTLAPAVRALAEAESDADRRAAGAAIADALGRFDAALAAAPWLAGAAPGWADLVVAPWAARAAALGAADAAELPARAAAWIGRLAFLPDVRAEAAAAGWLGDAAA